LEFDFDKYGDVKTLAFGGLGNLDEDSINFLISQVPGYGFFTDNTKEFIGGNLEYEIDDWEFFSQVIAGRDGELERSGWYSELSKKVDIDFWEYPNWIRPLVRYSELNVNLPPQPYGIYGSRTWDREQWLIALITEIRDNLMFRTEYLINKEETGGPDADNNELLFQLEIAF
jgi:hypothetical protein